jgi:hypothetical protein
MNRDQRDRQHFAIVRAVLADAVTRGVLSEDGHGTRCCYRTLLPGNIPADVTLSLFLRPRPAGDLPPEAYLKFELWPDEPRPRPHGHFSVAFPGDRGWTLYGDYNYRAVVKRTEALEDLVKETLRLRLQPSQSTAQNAVSPQSA